MLELLPSLQHLSAHGEGTGFLLAPTQIVSPQLASITWTMAQQSLHHALCFPSHFHHDRLSSFWKMPPSPTGTVSPFIARDGDSQPLSVSSSLAFAFSCISWGVPLYFQWLSGFLICFVLFFPLLLRGLKSHSLLFLLLILLYLFPHPFSQSNARKNCLEHTSQPFNWRH